MGGLGKESTAGAGGAGACGGCDRTLGSAAGKGDGAIGKDGTLGSAAGTCIGSGSKPGGTVGVVVPVVGVRILAGLWLATSLKNCRQLL